MMVFFESDLRILYFVVTEMATAGITLTIVAILGLPDWHSGLIVTSVMIMIDITIFGFMYYWNIKLNMISMVNLLLSIGFAVDYSTHISHTFLECLGPNKNSRVIESLVLMGNPIFHGAIASLLGIVMLGFSTSHIFQIFFKMMILVSLCTYFSAMNPEIRIPAKSVGMKEIGSKKLGCQPSFAFPQ